MVRVESNVILVVEAAVGILLGAELGGEDVGVDGLEAELWWQHRDILSCGGLNGKVGSCEEVGGLTGICCDIGGDLINYRLMLNLGL